MTLRGSVRLPGLADAHVHLRVPGGEHKEDFRSGTAAALAGGFTTLLAMPNTQPPLSTPAAFHATLQRARAEALCDVHLFAGAAPADLDALPALADGAVGLKIYWNETYGPLRLTNLTHLLTCFQTWPRSRIIALHAEGEAVAIAIGLAAVFERPVHICHVSRAEEIRLIASAKARGLPVTCEVTPHHLLLTDADARALGPKGLVRPPLASPADVAALWSHIDTTIDCIATDHAPHTLEEKLSPEGSPPGMPGLETALPLMLTAVAEGRLSLERLVHLMATAPRRIFGLPSQPETWIDIDLDARYTLTDEGLHSKCGWSPFSGYRVQGRLHHVQYRGQTAYREGAVLSIHSPGGTRL